MADTATTQDPELQDANLGQAGDSQQNDKPNPNEVKIREPFEIGGALHIIYDIEVDKKGKRTSNWRIKEGSQVEVSGSGLEIYDQINLHIAGGVYLQKNIDRQAGGRLLDFTVSDEIKDLFAEGAEIELEFVSNANPANNRYLKQKFYYKGESAEEKAEAKKKLAEEQELKQAKEGQSSPGAVSEIINRTIGGTAEAFGQGMAGKPKPPVGAVPGSTDVNKTTNQRVVSDSQADKNIDDGQDLVAEEEQQAAAGLASTLAQSTVGAEVVGEGLTSQSSTVGTESISTGSTITGTESVSSGGTIKTSGTVSGGATTSVSGQEQAGGTISGTQKTSVFATDTGGGTAQATQTVSGSKTISGSEKVSATGSATQKIQSETSTSQNQQAASVEGTTSQRTATAEGQSTTEVKAESVSQAQNNAQSQESTDKVSAQETVQGQQSIKTEFKTPPAPDKSGNDLGTAKKSTEVGQKITGQEKVDEGKSSLKPTKQAPGFEKDNTGQLEKKSSNQTSEKSPAQKKPAPTSTAGFGGGFGTTGGTLPTQLGNLSGALNRFKANEAVLGSRLGSASGKQPLVALKQFGPDQNILSNEPQRVTGEKGDEEKEKLEGKKAEEQEERPLASPMGSSLSQEDMGEGKNQESSGKQDKETSLGKQKSGQEENPEQEPTGQQEESEAEPEQEARQPVQVIQKSSSAQSLGTAELAEAERLVNTTVNGYLQSLAIIIWSSALPTFGLSILFGAVVGDILWLLKDWAIKKALSKTPLPKKFSSVNIKDFRINFSLGIKAQIASWNAIVVGTVIFIGLFIFTILWGICNSWVTYPIRETGLKPICEVIDKSSLGQGLSNFQSTGSFSASYNTPGTLISTAQWTDQINSSAQKWNIDACILRVVVQKESGGNQSAIGCDCAANGNPQFCPDKRKIYSSDYQFNWQQCSYGIGLTQWTIYQSTYATSKTDFRRWQDSSTPSRTPFGNQFYTVSDFLNPQTSLDLTANKFSREMAKGKTVEDAFWSYVGDCRSTPDKCSVQTQYVRDRMALYNICKTGN